MTDLTIIVPSVPERKKLRKECIRSIEAQTEPCKWKLAIDEHHNGVIATMNALAGCVDTEWLMPLSDDDLIDADHVRVLSHWLDDADIVFTWCRIEGGGDEHPADQFQVRWQAEYGWEHLRNVNWIPATAAIRTDLWNDLGGYREADWTQHEDWDFLVRSLDAGARFRCVPAVTWTYRLNDDWEHRSTCESSS